jgi:Protease inhibitor Inh
MSVRSNLKAAICVVSCLLGLGLFCIDHAAAGWWTVWADIPGRWVMRTPGRSRCVLGFSGAPDIPHGTIAAMGFCPQIFSALPRWRLDAGRVVITNRHGATLAELAVAATDRLEGQIATGEAVFLAR